MSNLAEATERSNHSLEGTLRGGVQARETTTSSGIALSNYAARFLNAIYESKGRILSYPQLKEIPYLQDVSVDYIGSALVRMGLVARDNGSFALTEAGECEALRQIKSGELQEGLANGISGCLSTRYSALVALMRRENGIKPREMSRKLRLNSSGVYNILKWLSDQGIVVRTGRGEYILNSLKSVSSPTTEVPIEKSDTASIGKKKSDPPKQTPKKPAERQDPQKQTQDKPALKRGGRARKKPQFRKKEQPTKPDRPSRAEIIKTKRPPLGSEKLPPVTPPLADNSKKQTPKTPPAPSGHPPAYTQERPRGYGDFIGPKREREYARVLGAPTIPSKYDLKPEAFPLVEGKHLPDFVVSVPEKDPEKEYRFPRMYMEREKGIRIKYLFAHHKTAKFGNRLEEEANRHPAVQLRLSMSTEWNPINFWQDGTLKGDTTVSAITMTCEDAFNDELKDAVNALYIIGEGFRRIFERENAREAEDRPVDLPPLEVLIAAYREQQEQPSNA